MEAKKFFEENKKRIEDYEKLLQELNDAIGYCSSPNEFDKRLISKTVDLVLEEKGIRNLLIQYQEFEKCQSFEEIEEKLQKQYLICADEIALAEIVKTAKRALPNIDWNLRQEREKEGKSQYQLTDIVDNTKLVLSIYSEKLFDCWRICFSEFEVISALDKLMQITLLDATPSTIKDGFFLKYCYTNGSEKDGVYQRKYSVNGLIEYTQVYKNGKFVIKFRDKEDAKKVALALIK